ncbi:MAG TPA: biotin/lipoyl-containing protein, partial [Steroidobacteraceae bacterium]|nr:biotin/lipoyl-containing protein [Steroidobacteraceae bacterium]
MAVAIHPVTMPKWGIEMVQGTLNQWSVAQGARVDKGDPLLEVETDKIVNTVESPAAGCVRRIVAEAGETLPVGALIAILAEDSVSDAEINSFIANF